MIKHDSVMIEVEKVSKSFKKVLVLNQININFCRGKIYGIQGVNGSGKTMLLRAISGFLHPDSGKIRIDGAQLYDDMDFPKSIGVLIENPAFLGMYSGFVNLKLLASIRNCINDSDISKIMEKVGLNPMDKKKYRKYSLGMKQKLGLAAVFMEQPDLLIFDEPTNALDDLGVRTLKSLILREKERGACILLSSHDIIFLRAMSDELYHMDSGMLTKIEVE